jgi:N-acetylated-alpha-linked acidic dipeptidase
MALPPADVRAGDDPALEQRFDAGIDPQDLSSWMKQLASQPNQVGSLHDKANADWILAQFRSWGWDAHIETFRVLYPTPLRVSLTLPGHDSFHATLTEPPIPGDATTSRLKDALPAYVAYQGDGDVTAPLVYVNYGMPDDYKALQRLGVSVKGRIVIVRYGAGWRGLKPRLALQHGAVGCIIYSDPADDGYGAQDVYPQGPARPAGGVQRGSVADTTEFPGDPLTPGVGATDSAQRLSIKDAPTLVRIPTLPISYSDARHFLERMGGQVAPANWRGALPITYHVGDGSVSAHLVVESDWSLKTIYDVVAVLKGAELPDQWVLRGNHHDGWVFGASDPESGQVALLAEAKALGGLVAQGWRPKRTLVYLSWDAEEPGLIGSTEWVEAHSEELRQKALVYINTDANARGILDAEGSQSLQRLVDEVAAAVVDPETHVSVAARRRAAMRVAGEEADASPAGKADARIAADAGHSLPIGALGSGSDFSPFIQHLGIASLSLQFGGEGDWDGVYHSSYDTWEHHSRFVDPGFAYDALLAKVAGRAALRLADAEQPVQRYADFAEAVGGYVTEVKALADARRAAADQQSQLLTADAYRLADDPTLSRGDPLVLPPVPHFNFAPLENAADHVSRAAKEFDAALSAGSAQLSPGTMAHVFAQLQTIEQLLAPEPGLPGRPWYRNLICAPGRLTGYSAKTLPGVREAIEDGRWDDVDRYAQLTGQALERYAARLEETHRLIAP